ncbi:Uncharacterised protein [BD1-7 clade bacterium]|uniref:Uncharacterized protein n=1 Tax=BD1-7 clade bacterium TaxID=2029982 RepID=A0A5S9QQL5_9GAMM|nr:Uncharacterised protein [BD1-7 clade bacterium]CAA0121535.1 Uncharacterised protein [BD1-7 clade bacterium]
MRYKHLLSSGVAALTLVVSASAHAEGDGMRLGDGSARMKYGVDVTEGYDDNIYATRDEEVGALKSSIKPYISFEMDRQDSFYSASLYLDALFYSGASQNDSVDYQIAFLVDEVFNSRNRLKVDFDYGRYTETRSFDDQEILPRYDGGNFAARYGFGSKEVFFNFDLYTRYGVKEYNAGNTSKDSRDLKFGWEGFFKVASTLDGVLDIRLSDLRYVNDADSDVKVTTVLGGLQWQSTAKTTGHIKVGVQRQNSRADYRRTRPSIEVGATWSPQTYMVFRFIAENGFGLDSQSGEFTQYNKIGFNWDHTWSDHWSTNFDMAYLDEDLIAGTAAGGVQAGEILLNRQLQEYTLKGTYKIVRWADVHVGYTFSNRDANDEGRIANANDIYTRNYAFIGANIGF